MKRKAVVGVVGMPGSGKAAVKEIVRDMGYSVVVMGDEIREEAERRKLKPTQKILGQLMLKLRKDEGQGVVARRCIPKIELAEEKVVFVDGIRSLHEVNEFRKHFRKFFLIAIHTSPRTRFHRLFQRKRSDDPKSWEAFVERDSRELNVGLGDAIAMADYMLPNERSKEQLKREMRRVLESVLAKWMK